MRAVKYLPLFVSNTSVYFRNAINYSLQKFNSFDINIITNKYKILEEKNETKVSANGVEEANGRPNGVTESVDSVSANANVKPNDSLHQHLIDTINEWMASHTNKTDSSRDNRGVSHPNNDIKDVKSDLSTNEGIIANNVTIVPSLTSHDIERCAKQLVNSLKSTDSPANAVINLKELIRHLVNYPESGVFAEKEGAIRTVLRLREWSKDRLIRLHATQVLTLLGFCDPPNGRGIRILSIDGGGTRGVLVIEMLRQIEKMSGKPIHELFDLICGVSTGAIISMLVGALQTPIDECEEYYRKFSSHLFKSDFWRGAGRLIMSHAYYDTAVWEKILKDIYSEMDLIETVHDHRVPRILAISAVMNAPTIQAFLFRNYELPLESRARSQYEGSARYKVWQAVRASAAAPGYFEEFALDNYVHQDGGILINNPTAIAIHEAKMLWPNERIQCVLSLGSGRYIPPITPKSVESPVSPTSLKTKLVKLIDSATDTEIVHRLMQDLLPPDSYCRLNPNLTETSTLDENRPEKLAQMKTDANMYLRKNEIKVNKAIHNVMKRRNSLQTVDDWLQLQYRLRV